MAKHSTLTQLETLALIAIGGFAGSNLRFFTLGVLSDVQAIAVVNVLGSLALAFLLYEAQYTGYLDRSSRVLFTTGFLSSLTTYSGFAILTATAESPALTVAIVAGNYGLAVLGVLAGRALARRVPTRGDRS